MTSMASDRATCVAAAPATAAAPSAAAAPVAAAASDLGDPGATRLDEHLGQRHRFVREIWSERWIGGRRLARADRLGDSLHAPRQTARYGPTSVPTHADQEPLPTRSSPVPGGAGGTLMGHIRLS